MKTKTQLAKEMKEKGLNPVTWLRKPTIQRLITMKNKIEEKGIVLILIDDVVNMALDAYEEKEK